MRANALIILVIVVIIALVVLLLQRKQEVKKADPTDSNLKRFDVDEYDIIICGAGTAGSVLAEYISRVRPGKSMSILVLDAGRNENLSTISLDALNLGEFGPGSGIQTYPNTFDYLAALTTNLGDNMSNGVYSANEGSRIYPIIAGRGWGGASKVNYLLTVRASPGHAQAQSALLGGSAKWGPSNMNNLYQELEGVMQFDPFFTPEAPAANRGTEGRFKTVSFRDGYGGYAASTITEMQNIYGNVLPADNDYNNNENFALPSATSNLFIDPMNFLRSHAGTNFLGEDVVNQTTGVGVDGRNIRVISDAFVDKIGFVGVDKVARTVTATVSGTRRVFKAREKIILCAGGSRTPGILERSGIGSAAALPAIGGETYFNRFEGLDALGIPVVVNNPNVGEHFQTHPYNQTWVSMPYAEFNPGYPIVTLPPRPGTFSAPQSGNGHNRMYLSGVFLTPPIPETANGYPLARQVLEAFGVPQGFDDGSRFTVSTFQMMTQPTSEGYCHIANSNPETDPNQTYNMNSTPEDKQAAREHSRLWKATFEAANIGATIHYPPPAAFADDDALDGFLRGDLQPTWHQSGTCRMGNSIADGVVDHNLHVFGVRDLMIADMSVYRIIPDGNTTFPAAVIGLQAGKIIMGEY